MAGGNEKQEQMVSRSIEDFTTDFHKQVAGKSEGNLVFSAFSAHVVLSMTASGAGGSTAQQMRQILRLPECNEEVNQGYQSFTDAINNIQRVTLKVANKIYASKSIIVKDKFKEITSTHFRSESGTIDVSKPGESAAEVNQWCFNNTNGKIPTIISSNNICAYTTMILLNAVYFKGDWNDKFNSKETKCRPFHIDKTTTVNVPTMFIKKQFCFKELPAQSASYIAIPYKNQDLRMIIIIPNEIDGLKYVEDNLEKIDTTVLSRAFNMVDEVSLYLPKFKIETSLDLKEHLQKMRMTEMFIDGANFSEISNEPLKVDKVVQKAFIEVNEEGTEAAAITAVTMAFGCAMPRRPRILKVDRPFIYKLMWKNSTLFSGHVVNPLES